MSEQTARGIVQRSLEPGDCGSGLTPDHLVTLDRSLHFAAPQFPFWAPPPCKFPRSPLFQPTIGLFHNIVCSYSLFLLALSLHCSLDCKPLLSIWSLIVNPEPGSCQHSKKKKKSFNEWMNEISDDLVLIWYGFSSSHSKNKNHYIKKFPCFSQGTHGEMDD